MSKKHKPAQRSRDTPAAQPMVGVTNWELWWRDLTDEGYVPLWQCPEVAICVHQYADLISNMTIHLKRNTERGDERVRNELSRKVDVNPAPNMGRKQFIYHVVSTMMTVGEGNCVVYPRYSPEGYLEDLIPLRPSAVQFQETDDGYRILYGQREFRSEEVLHFRMNPDPERPWLGTGWRITLRQLVDSIRKANSTKNKILSSPAPSIVVMVDGYSEDLTSPEGRERLTQKYIDSQQSGRPWLLQADTMKIEQVKPLTMSDLAIRDNIELDATKIARVMGVPAFLTGVGAYNQDEYNAFINTRIVGVAQYLQQEMTQKLLISPDLYWSFNPRSLYNYKLSDLIQAGAEMVDRMAMRRNEWRDWVYLSPDPDMDELLALENYIPADRLGDQKKLQNGGGE